MKLGRAREINSSLLVIDNANLSGVVNGQENSDLSQLDGADGLRFREKDGMTEIRPVVAEALRRMEELDISLASRDRTEVIEDQYSDWILKALDLMERTDVQSLLKKGPDPENNTRTKHVSHQIQLAHHLRVKRRLSAFFRWKIAINLKMNKWMQGLAGFPEFSQIEELRDFPEFRSTDTLEDIKKFAIECLKETMKGSEEEVAFAAKCIELGFTEIAEITGLSLMHAAE